MTVVPLLSSLCPPLFGTGVLGHGLGALGHGVLCQLTGEQKADGGLDLPGGDGCEVLSFFEYYEKFIEFSW